MKTIITKGFMLALLLVSGLILELKAQQDGFTYQGAVRNADGSIIADETLPVRISIISGTSEGTVVWRETHNANTNVLGIFTIIVGNGTKTGGSAAEFADINWGSAAHFIKTEVNFGSGLTEMSNVQLFSVPYALVAKKASEVINKPNYAFDELSDVNLTGLQNGDILKYNGTNWVVSQLPPSTVNTAAGIEGNGSAASPIKLAQQGAQQGQTLKWNGNAWVPSNDNDALTVTSGALSGNGTANNPVTISRGGATSGQVLKWDGTAWVPSDDNGMPERIVLNVDNSAEGAPAVKLNVTGSRSSAAQTIEMSTDSSSNALEVRNFSNVGGIGKTGVYVQSRGEGSSHSAIIGEVSGANSVVLRGIGGFIDVTGNVEPGFNVYGTTGTVYGESTNPAKISVGVYGQTNPTGAGESWGTGGFAGGGGVNRAFRGRANSVVGNTSPQWGAWLQANGSGTGDHYGVWANAMGTGRNIGVYGTASGGTDNLAGLFEGNVHTQGKLSVAVADGMENQNTTLIAESTGPGDGQTGWGTGSYNVGLRGNASNNAWGNVGVTGYARGSVGFINSGGTFFGQVDDGTTTVINQGLYTIGNGPGVNYGIFAQAQGGVENWAGYFEGDLKVTGRLIVDGETTIGQTDQLSLGAPGLTNWQAIKDEAGAYIGAQLNFGGADTANTIASGGGSLGNKFWEANNPENGYLHINTLNGTRASLEGLTNSTQDWGVLTLTGSSGFTNRVTNGGFSIVNPDNKVSITTNVNATSGAGSIYTRTNFSTFPVGWFGTSGRNGFSQLVGFNADSTISGAILNGFWTGVPTMYLEDGNEVPMFVSDLEVTDAENYATRGRIRLGTGENVNWDNFGVEIYGDGNAVFKADLRVDGNIRGNINDGEVFLGTDEALNEDFGKLSLFQAGGSVETIRLAGNDGSARFDGTITATTVNQTSDARYKTNIKTLNGSLNNVLKMRGVSYNWLDKNKTQKNQIGVIAQEVESIYPEFVHTDDKGMKSVNYAQMTAVLIEAIKELNAQVESLKIENNSLKADLSKAEANSDRIAQLEANMQNLMKMIQNSNPSNSSSTPGDK